MPTALRVCARLAWPVQKLPVNEASSVLESALACVCYLTLNYQCTVVCPSARLLTTDKSGDKFAVSCVSVDAQITRFMCPA